MPRIPVGLFIVVMAMALMSTISTQPATAQSCNQNFLYNSGNATNLTSGLTVGGPLPTDDWMPFQPIIPTDVWNVCGIDLDGWYLTGTPTTVTVSIFHDVGGNPDLANPLTSGTLQLGSQGQINWVQVNVPPVCLDPGLVYYVGVDPGPGTNHWSSVYNIGPTGLASFSINNYNLGQKFPSTPMAVRLRGSINCGPPSCLLLSFDQVIGGQITTWTAAAVTPGQRAIFIWGLQPGTTVVSGTFGYCATFDINNVGTNNVIGQAVANGSGVAITSKFIPNGASGLLVYFQAAERGTCPNECVSNLIAGAIQ